MYLTDVYIIDQQTPFCDSFGKCTGNEVRHKSSTLIIKQLENKFSMDRFKHKAYSMAMKQFNMYLFALALIFQSLRTSFTIF